MIILFSIFLLLVLVYCGIRMKEGMTTNVGSQLIDLLGTYYAAKESNAAANPPIDNSRNAKTTLDGIVKLNITDAPYAGIINNNDIDNESKINMIKTSLNKVLTKENKQPNLDINKYRGILSVLQDSSLSGQPGQQVSEVKQIVYLTSKDPRFSYIFDGTVEYADDMARLEAIKTATYNTLNPV